MTRRDVDEDRVRSVAMAGLLAVFLLTGPAVTYGAAAMPFLDVTCLGSAAGGQSSSMLRGAPTGGHAKAAVGGDDTTGAGSVVESPTAESDMTLAELRAQGGIDEASSDGAVSDDRSSGSDRAQREVDEGTAVSEMSVTAGQLARVTDLVAVAPSVSVNRTIYAEERGDVVAIGLTLTDTDRATVTVGDVSTNGFAQNVTVRDGDGDGFVALTVNTYTAGNSEQAGEGSAVVYSTGASGDEVLTVEAANGTFDPASPDADTLPAADYEVLAVAGETPAERTGTGADATGTVSLDTRSTDSVRIYSASRNRQPDRANGLSDEISSGTVREVTNVVAEDYLLVRVDASGLEGVLANRTAGGSATAAEAFFDEAASGHGAWSFQVRERHSNQYVASIDASNTDLYRGATNDRYWLVVDTGAVGEFATGDDLQTDFTTEATNGLNAGDVTVSDDWSYVTPSVTVDTNADTDNDGMADEVTVQQAAGQTISGTTNFRGNLDIEVKITGTDTGSPFVKPLSTYTEESRTWSVSADFGDNAQGANFVIDVRRDTTDLLDESVDGRISAAPTASVTFDDQETFGSSVTVSSVTMSDGGFLAIRVDNDSGNVIGHSDYIAAGSDSDVPISLTDPLEEDTTLVAMAHQDTDGDQVYEFEAGSSVDAPYSDNGAAVSDPAAISVSDPVTTTSTPCDSTTTSTETTTVLTTSTDTTTDTATPTPTPTATPSPTATPTTTPTTTSTATPTPTATPTTTPTATPTPTDQDEDTGSNDGDEESTPTPTTTDEETTERTTDDDDDPATDDDDDPATDDGGGLTTDGSDESTTDGGNDLTTDGDDAAAAADDIETTEDGGGQVTSFVETVAETTTTAGPGFTITFALFVLAGMALLSARRDL